MLDWQGHRKEDKRRNLKYIEGEKKRGLIPLNFLDKNQEIDQEIDFSSDPV